MTVEALFIAVWGGDPVYPTVNYIQDPNAVIDYRGPDFHEPTPNILAYLKEVISSTTSHLRCLSFFFLVVFFGSSNPSFQLKSVWLLNRSKMLFFR